MSFYIYPAIDLLRGQVVRLQQGDYERVTVYHDDAAAQARAFQEAGASHLHVVDLDGARDGAQKNRDHLKAIRGAFDGFIEVGGGLRDEAAVAALFEAGIDNAILGTAALENPALVARLVKEHSAQKITVGVDARDGFVSVHGWKETGGKRATDLLRELYDIGVRRFIVTDIATDGMLTGPNLEAITEAAEAVSGSGQKEAAEIIASGGVASIEDIEALSKMVAPNVTGVITGKAIYDGRLDVKESLKFERS